MEYQILDPRLNELDLAPATAASAGIDLRACIDKPLVLLPMACELVPSGLAIHIGRKDWVGLIYPRSGLGHRQGVVLGNLTGVIDADYQGEIKISLWNRSQEPQTIEPLTRVAQLVFMPVMHPTLEKVEQFSDESQRAAGGFGHTGKH